MKSKILKKISSVGLSSTIGLTSSTLLEQSQITFAMEQNNNANQDLNSLLKSCNPMFVERFNMNNDKFVHGISIEILKDVVDGEKI